MSLLVSAQFAIALVLITGAALLSQSFWKMRYRDLGFQSEHVIAAQLHLSKKRFPAVAQQASFADELLQQVQQMPGVEGAAIGELPPGEGHATNGFAIEGQLSAPSGRKPVARRFSITTEYFQLLGVPVLRGRGFLSTDNATAQPVAIVNQAFAQQNFPNGDAIGARIHAEQNEPWQTIVGVVANVKTAGLMKEPEPTFYRSFSQFGATDDIGLLVRTATPPTLITPQLRHALADVDPEQALVQLQTLNERLSDSVSQPREATILFTAFALIALLIAAIGLYGTMSFLVGGKLREMGIRLSLGAEPSNLLRMILLQSLRIAAIGVVAGALAAMWLSRYLQNLLYRTAPLDAATFGASISFLLIISVAAAYFPARKAAKVDPASTLRCE
jgi:predicted permease